MYFQAYIVLVRHFILTLWYKLLATKLIVVSLDYTELHVGTVFLYSYTNRSLLGDGAEIESEPFLHLSFSNQKADEGRSQLC